MKGQYMMNAEDICNELGISRGYAWHFQRLCLQDYPGTESGIERVWIYCDRWKSSQSLLGEKVLRQSVSDGNGIGRREHNAGL